MREIVTLPRLSVSLLLAALCVGGTASVASAGTVFALYPRGALSSLGVPESRTKMGETGEAMIFNVSEPTLELFLPPPGHGTSTAVIVAPGGGFVGLGYDEGGVAIARALSERGVTALVLKYRTIRSPDDAMHMPPVHMREMAAIMARAKNGHPAEVPRFAGEAHAVEDGERAMAFVRRHASKWGIDPGRIGVLGFSSGAFLAADLAIGNRSSRPAFVGLIYGGVRGPVPRHASPAFIAAASDDPYVPDDGVRLYGAWRRAGVPAELHLFAHGGHGFTLAPKGTTSDHWFDEFIWWMQAEGLLKQ